MASKGCETSSLKSLAFAYEDEFKRSLITRFCLPPTPEAILSINDARIRFDTLLKLARIGCLSKTEQYFLSPDVDFNRPLNFRNEAASISLVLRDIDQQDVRSILRAYSQSLWPEFETAHTTTAPPASYPLPATSPACVFQKWAKDNSIESQISIAIFSNSLRGCAALQDIQPGDNILSIPKDALIYEETVRETDVGQMLRAIAERIQLDVENQMIVFTMIDRYDEDSKWAPFWKTLPDKFYTGLSYPPHVLKLLDTTAAAKELAQAQAHLRAQYASTKPLFDMLLQAYPSLLDDTWFDYEHYVWATELWYSYAFAVEFPENEYKDVMVPFACHLNHSPWPHVVRYGRIDNGSMLRFPAFRPCLKGCQMFISYGPVPNLKLLCFYGFVVENNPHDIVPLEFDQEVSEMQKEAMKQYNLQLKEHSLRNGPLAPSLLALLRVLVATEDELRDMLASKVNPIAGRVNEANENQALETLRVALEGLLEGVNASLALCSLEKGQDERIEHNENGLDGSFQNSKRFCEMYLEGQRSILMRGIYGEAGSMTG